MNSDDDSNGGDLDIRDLLDELVNWSLSAISAISLADKLLTLNIGQNEREYCMIRKQEARADLNEISRCYKSTIGYH